MAQPRDFAILGPEIDPEYYIQAYGRELSVTNTGTGRLEHRGFYYGSSTRALHDVIDGNGDLHPFLLVLFRRRPDGPDLEISRFDSADIPDQLAQYVKHLHPRIPAIVPVALPVAVGPDLPPPAHIRGGGRCLRSPDGQWSVTLRDLHRWRGLDQPYDPHEISSIHITLEG